MITVVSATWPGWQTYLASTRSENQSALTSVDVAKFSLVVGVGWVNPPHSSVRDPIELANLIARNFSVDIVIPEKFEHRIHDVDASIPTDHPSADSITINGDGWNGNVNGPVGAFNLGVSGLSEPLINPGILIPRPDVSATLAQPPTDVLPANSNKRLRIDLAWTGITDTEIPTHMTDHRGRRFSVTPGSTAPVGKSPLLITYDRLDGSAQALVAYCRVQEQSKDFPEFVDYTPPMEWRDGIASA